jgi:hypothetical protein
MTLLWQSRIPPRNQQRIDQLRRQTGVHSLELVAGLTFLVPIFLYAVDYACVLYGGFMNDNLCGAAARAAASGCPTSLANLWGYTYPKDRAYNVISNASRPGSVVCVKRTVRVREVVNSPIPGPPYGGPVQGYITVKTRCDVYPPFSLPFVAGDVVLYTSQTYPWSWVMPCSPSSPSGYMVSAPIVGGPIVPGSRGDGGDISMPIPASAP